MTLAISPSIAVLAGGKSRRMGRDKARLELEGATLLERIAHVASRVAPTIVVGRVREDDFQFPEIPFIEDQEPGLGPVGGLQTALIHFDTPAIVLGCDMPLLHPSSLQWLVERFLELDGHDGLATRREDGLEPLFSVYRPRVLTEIDAMLDDGERSLRRLISRGDFEEVPVPEHVAATLTNVNTPEDFDAIST